MSYQGMDTLKRLLQRQADDVAAVDGYLRDAGLYESGSFDRGILSSFRDPYDRATDDVFASVSASRSTAWRIVERVAATEADLHDVDADVTRLMTRLVEASDRLQVPAPVGRIGGMLGVGRMEPPPDPLPKRRKDIGPRSINGLVNAGDNLAGMANQADRTREGLDARAEIDDFMEGLDD